MKIFRCLFSSGAILSFVVAAHATPLSGTKSVGPSGDYASLTAAIADIQAVGNGLGGALVLELQSDYAGSIETFPLTIPALNGASAVNTLTIRPASGATALFISSADTTATVDLNGAQFVIIDGRPGGVGSNAGSGGGLASQLNIGNTNTSGVALRFVNEASSNTLRYTTLRGVNTSALSGVVFFGTTTGANGNDYNTIDHCDIRDGASTPANGIFSAGTTTTTAQNNSGNTISNCNIFNFYAAGNAAGVLLNNGNTDWNLTGNSFYQTASRASAAGTVQAISTSGAGNNFTVSGNFIGGSAPNAGGAAWTTTGASAYLFRGISLFAGTNTPSSVQGNTISNIVWTSSSSALVIPGVWIGIFVQSGSVNIGTVAGNTVGGGSGTGSISVTTSGNGGTSFGIGSAANGTVAIANNVIGSITVNGSATTISASLTGINISAGAGTISNNTVGSTTTANSLNAATLSISATGQQVTGILVSNLGPGTNKASITGNTVANLNNNYVGTATTGQILGIVTSTGTNNITGNTVRNLSTTSANANPSAAQSVYGIIDTSPAAGQTVSQNTVHSLANTAASAVVSVSGIYYAGPSSGTNLISRNLVHSLAISSTNVLSQVHGMNFVNGAFTVQNNMVRLGLKADGTSTAGASNVRGILDNDDLTAGRNFYHNSVYVGGTQTSGGSLTFAFQSGRVANVRAFQNNLFVNARSNSGATSKHYAIVCANGVLGLTSDGNIFRASGAGGVLGFYNADRTNLAAWQAATGQDGSSAVADPLFINPTGDASTVDLHLQPSNPAEGGGIPIASVTDDFDGQTRGTLTPVDIGADAGNFTSTGDIFAPGISYTILSNTLSLASRLLPGYATITDNVGVSGGAKSPRLYFKKSADADAFNVPNDSTGNGWKYATASNASSPYDFTVDYSLLNGGGVANADTIQYFLIAQDEANNFASRPLGAASSANPPVQNVNAKPGSVNSYRVGDFTAPVISYPLLTIGSTANRVLTGWAAITDNAGVASGANAPRLYFKKLTDTDAFGVANNSTGNGWKYVTATGSGPYNFTLDYSLINGGSVTSGDTIQYFVVAQDAENNFVSNPAGATASVNPPVQNVNGHGAVNSYSILAGSLSGTKTVGSGGDYPSLSGAGGLFAALNGAVLAGNVVVNITGDLTEDGSVTLGEFRSNDYPLPKYTLTLRPDSATMRTVSGSAAAGLVTLNGADRVTMDGRFGGNGRYLTFRNTNNGGSASTILFINDASSNTVINCVVEGATTSATLGVISFSTGAVTGNDNNLITGCQLRDLSTTAGVPRNLIGSSGSSAAVANSGDTISNNELFNFNEVGIDISGTGNDSWTLSGNNIYEVNAGTNSNFGISMGGGGTNVITGNSIHDLLTTGTGSVGIYLPGGFSTTTTSRNRITAFNVNAATTIVFGIEIVGGNGATLNVENNQITLSPAAPGSMACYGIYDFGIGVLNVSYNSIVIGGTETGGNDSWIIERRNGSSCTARDNLFLNVRTGGTGNHFAAGSEGTGGSFTVGNNVYAGTGATATDFMGFSTLGLAVPVSFATWQSSTHDTNSQADIAGSGNFTTAMFVNAATGDLHLVPFGNVLVNALAMPIAGVTNDFDGDLRNATTPTIGSDELNGYNQLTPQPQGGGTNVLTFLGTPGLNYTLEFATNLIPPIDWQPQVTNTAATNGSIIFTNVTSVSPVFYRTHHVP